MKVGVKISVVVVEDDETNHDGEDLVVGTDTDGTTKRTLIKFDLDEVPGMSFNHSRYNVTSFRDILELLNFHVG